MRREARRSNMTKFFVRVVVVVLLLLLLLLRKAEPVDGVGWCNGCGVCVCVWGVGAGSAGYFSIV